MCRFASVTIPLAVTTSGYGDPSLEARARSAAQRLDLPFLHRRRKASLAKMIGTSAQALLVFGGDGVTLVDAEGALRFSPGMAQLRMKRLDAGVFDDTLLRLGEVRPGDRLLDATLGLAADALTCARAIGPQGQVIGLEKSPALFALVSSGLEDRAVDPRSAPILAQRVDAAQYLAAAPAGSFDCVLLDPMFESPRRASPAFQILRRYADHSPVTAEMISQAQRVARRWVLVKGARYSQDLRKLGLVSERVSRSATVAWARIKGGLTPP